MQIYDILMLAVLGVSVIFGAIKGFAWQIASLASIVVSYFVAYTFRNDVAKMIHAQEPWNGFLAMLLLYAASSFVIWVVFRLVSGTIDQVRLRDFDRQMGALMGLGKGVVYCLLITMFAVTLLGPNQQHAIVSSRSGGYISKILAATDGIVLPKEVEQIVRPYLNRVEQQLGQNGNNQSPPSSNWGSGFFPSSGTQEQGGGSGFGFGGTQPAIPVWSQNWSQQPSAQPPSNQLPSMNQGGGNFSNTPDYLPFGS